MTAKTISGVFWQGIGSWFEPDAYTMNVSIHSVSTSLRSQCIPWISCIRFHVPWPNSEASIYYSKKNSKINRFHFTSHSNAFYAMLTHVGEQLKKKNFLRQNMLASFYGIPNGFSFLSNTISFKSFPSSFLCWDLITTFPLLKALLVKFLRQEL